MKKIVLMLVLLGSFVFGHQILPVTINKEYKFQNNWESGKDFYADILNHMKRKPNYYDDRNTTAHEATHQVNSQIRNEMFISGQKYYYNAVYLGNDKYYLFKEPNLKLSDIAELVPDAFKKGGYDNYLIKQQSGWNDMPLYILDEAIAFNNGNQVSVDDALLNVFPPFKSSTMEYSIEFIVFSVCLTMSMDEKDPDYLKNEKEFVDFFKWYIINSLNIYKNSQKFDFYIWDKQHILFNELVSGKSCEKIRNFVKLKFNIDLSKFTL